MAMAQEEILMGQCEALGPLEHPPEAAPEGLLFRVYSCDSYAIL